MRASRPVRAALSWQPEARQGGRERAASRRGRWGACHHARLGHDTAAPLAATLSGARAACPGGPRRSRCHSPKLLRCLATPEPEEGGGAVDEDAGVAAPQPRGWWPVTAATQGTMLLGFGGMLANTGFSLQGPTSVAEALAVLAGIIFVHEAGHFSVARGLGMHVTKFAVGFGPRLLSYNGPEVEYSLSLVPLGGFVQFPDDDPACPYPPDDPDLFRNRPLLQRCAVTLAGVAANCVFALGLLITQAGTVGQLQSTFLPGVAVPELLPISAARDAGIREGDIIIAVDGETVAASATSVNRTVARIRTTKGGAPLVLTVARAGAPAPLDVTVKPDIGPSGMARIGVQLEARVQTTHVIANSPGQAVAMGASDFVRLTEVVFRGLSDLVMHFEDVADSVSGPVAIVAVGAKVAAATDRAPLFQFASILNINLAIVNLVPLPALDGGALALLVLEGIRGGVRLPKEVEQLITASGLLLVTLVGVTLIVRDTVHLVGG